MQLYHLLAGKSKKRMRIIATDELHKVTNLKNAREKSGCAEKWMQVVEAEKDATIYRKVNPGTRMWAAYNKDRSRGGIPRSI
jgi:hypothetical protein